MAMQQMLLSSSQSQNDLVSYVVANWTKFYKGQMVRTDTQRNAAGNVVYGYDDQSSNNFYLVPSTFSLSDIPFGYTNSTMFYMEYKVEPLVATNQGGFSSSAPDSPKYGVTTIYKNNANTNPATEYQEAFPNPGNTWYGAGPVNYYTQMTGSYAMQARSMSVARMAVDAKTITGSQFYQNGYNNASDSPSTLLLPGFWRKTGDSGGTTFSYIDVTSYEGESQTYYTPGYVMDTTTPATFSVLPGDLIIGTTILAKHPVDAVPAGDVDLLYSWNRARILNGGNNAHGMSIWFSKTTASYSISRDIAQYPGSRFLVFRYDAGGTGTIPTDASAPPGTGGSSSVSAMAYMPMYNKPAGDFVTGDELLLLSDDRSGVKSGQVVTNRISMQPLLTLVSESGIRLTCSTSTPLTLQDGSTINSTQAQGHLLPVQDNQGFRWEVITEVIDAGSGPVATIYCLDQCYAAGDQPDRWIWTHNIQQMKF